MKIYTWPMEFVVKTCAFLSLILVLALFNLIPFSEIISRINAAVLAVYFTKKWWVAKDKLVSVGMLPYIENAYWELSGFATNFFLCIIFGLGALNEIPNSDLVNNIASVIVLFFCLLALWAFFKLLIQYYDLNSK